MIPYTMPKPYPKHNEPAYLPHVLEALAQVFGVGPAEMAQLLEQVHHPLMAAARMSDFVLSLTPLVLNDD
jgi:hypothetical protein